MRELTATALKARMDAGEPILLLDVRESWEVDIAEFPGARPLSMAELPDALSTLPKASEIVVICHHGGRSFTAGMVLERAGFQAVTNLAGGIDGWSRDVDPAVPVY